MCAKSFTCIFKSFFYVIKRRKMGRSCFDGLVSKVYIFMKCGWNKCILLKTEEIYFFRVLNTWLLYIPKISLHIIKDTLLEIYFIHTMGLGKVYIYSVPRLVLHQSSLRALYFYVVLWKCIRWYKNSVRIVIPFKLLQF